MPEPPSRKVVRSYRVVFRRRWRIYRLQNWRLPLPGGLELRSIGYWLACLAALALLANLPLIGLAVGALPASLRLLALPVAGAWALSRWELDGRSPHRALAGLAAWRARPRVLAALRRCPAEGGELALAAKVAIAADLYGPSYPRGRLRGPARVLLRYPVAVTLRGRPARRGHQPRRAGGECPLLAPLAHRRRAASQRQDARGPRRADRDLRDRAGAAVRPPHYFFWGNLVLRSPSEAWAVYELEGQSYPGLSEQRKIEVGERLEALSYSIAADFQILRVARAFDAEAYVRRALTTLDPRHGRRERFAAHLAEHRSEFERREALRPEIYLAVRLAPPGGAGPLGGALEGAAALWGAIAERLGFEQAHGLGAAQIAALRREEEAAFERVLGYLECTRVGPRRLAALIRRAYTRGLGEPDADRGLRTAGAELPGPRWGGAL